MNPTIKQLKKYIQALDCRGLVWLFYAGCLVGWFGYLKIKNRTNRSDRVYRSDGSGRIDRIYRIDRNNRSDRSDRTNRSDMPVSDRVYRNNEINRSDRNNEINRSDRPDMSDRFDKTYRTYLTYRTNKTSQALRMVRHKKAYSIQSIAYSFEKEVRARIAGFVLKNTSGEEVLPVASNIALLARLHFVFFKERASLAYLDIKKYARRRSRYYLRKAKKVYVPAGISFAQAVFNLSLVALAVFGFVVVIIGKTFAKIVAVSIASLSLRSRRLRQSFIMLSIRLLRRYRSSQ